MSVMGRLCRTIAQRSSGRANALLARHQTSRLTASLGDLTLLPGLDLGPAPSYRSPAGGHEQVARMKDGYIALCWLASGCYRLTPLVWQYRISDGTGSNRPASAPKVCTD